ncbi:hypothetical protein [Dankookia sp. P2]|uniref:hypothetical protein n=1 Tax=Dankookia sp. P2 TaxID=3423955 RepID=UPI003D671CB1
MTDDPHEQRLRLLGRHYVPDHRTLPQEVRQRAEGRNRAERRARHKQAEKIIRRTVALCALAAESGAGLPMDRAIRDFLSEVNHREVSHGFDALPASFNVLEAFIGSRPADKVFDVRPERDHVFSLEDFLDYLTSSDGPADPCAALPSIPEGVVHSYNAVGDLESLAFIDGEGERHVISGISFVRHGDEVTWMLLCGPIVDIAAKSAEARAVRGSDATDMAPARAKGLALEHQPQAEAVVLEGTSNAWRTLMYGRFDLVSRRHRVRYVSVDHGWSLSHSHRRPERVRQPSGSPHRAGERRWPQPSGPSRGSPYCSTWRGRCSPSRPTLPSRCDLCRSAPSRPGWPPPRALAASAD